MGINRATSRRLKSLGFKRIPDLFPKDRFVCWQRVIGTSSIKVLMERNEDISYEELANRIARQAAFRAVKKIKEAITGDSYL